MRKSTRGLREAIILAGFVFFVVVLTSYDEWFGIEAWTRRFPEYSALRDVVITGTTCLAFGLAIYAWRRTRELREEVAERKQVEEALRKSEASLAEAQRIAFLGSWEWNIKTGEVVWSEETYRIYGLEPYGISPTLETVEEVFHPDDRHLFRATIKDAYQEEADSYDFEHRIVRLNGEVRWVQRRGEVVRGEGGEPLRMIGTVHDVTEHKAFEERLEYQAFHDELTDLPNRHLFMDRLEHALKRTGRRKKRKKVAVLFIDLNNFKVVNDSLGHEVGDRLLVAVGERLRRCLRPEDTFARFGGTSSPCSSRTSRTPKIQSG